MPPFFPFHDEDIFLLINQCVVHYLLLLLYIPSVCLSAQVVPQLEQMIKAKMDPQLESKVDLSTEAGTG
jgi:hypothetical protein